MDDKEEKPEITDPHAAHTPKPRITDPHAAHTPRPEITDPHAAHTPRPEITDPHAAHTPRPEITDPHAAHTPRPEITDPHAAHTPRPEITDPHAAHTPRPEITDPHAAHTPRPEITDPHAAHTPRPEITDPHAAHTPKPEITDPHAAHTPRPKITDPHAAHTPKPETTDPHATHTPSNFSKWVLNFIHNLELSSLWTKIKMSTILTNSPIVLVTVFLTLSIEKFWPGPGNPLTCNFTEDVNQSLLIENIQVSLKSYMYETVLFDIKSLNESCLDVGKRTEVLNNAQNIKTQELNESLEMFKAEVGVYRSLIERHILILNETVQKQNFSIKLILMNVEGINTTTMTLHSDVKKLFDSQKGFTDQLSSVEGSLDKTSHTATQAYEHIIQNVVATTQYSETWKLVPILGCFLGFLDLFILLYVIKRLQSSPVPTSNDQDKHRVNKDVKSAKALSKSTWKTVVNPGVSMVAFDQQTLSSFQSVLQAGTRTSIDGCLVTSTVALQSLTLTKIMFVFVAFNERNVILEEVGLLQGELRRKTVEFLLSNEVDVFVVYTGDKSSKVAELDNFYNSDLTSVRNHPILKSLVKRSRFMSVDTSFNKEQLSYIINTIQTSAKT